jgi:malate synthase
MVHRGDIDAPSMVGSWAGAMGQPQFLPSSYLAYAVDFDGDGRRDIWTSPADTLASIANYLRGAARWDVKASLFEYVMADAKQVRPDRFGVGIKTTPFIGDIFRRLVAICLKHGAVPIGGMATALPSNAAEVNRVAGEAMKADKLWGAEQGVLKMMGRAHLPHEGGGWSVQGIDWQRMEAVSADGGSVTVSGAHRGAEGWIQGPWLRFRRHHFREAASG